MSGCVVVPGAQSVSALLGFAGGNGGTGGGSGGMGKISAVWVAAKSAAAVVVQDSSSLRATFVGQNEVNVAAGAVVQ